MGVAEMKKERQKKKCVDGKKGGKIRKMNERNARHKRERKDQEK